MIDCDIGIAGEFGMTPVSQKDIGVDIRGEPNIFREEISESGKIEMWNIQHVSAILFFACDRIAAYLSARWLPAKSRNIGGARSKNHGYGRW